MNIQQKLIIIVAIIMLFTTTACNTLQQNKVQNSKETTISFEGYRLIHVDGGNLSGHREPNVDETPSQRGISVTINKKREYIPRINVKYTLSKLTQQHVVYVMEQFKGYTKPIKNKKGFLQSTIYNSVGEFNADAVNGGAVLGSE